MNYKVLIVDDSKLARMVVMRAVSRLRPDWRRFEAVDAEGALAFAKQEAPDIALVDFNMPGRDGLELAAEFRALAPRMRVAVVSANHQKEVVGRVEAVGASFLPKPVTEESLNAFFISAVDRLKATQP